MIYTITVNPAIDYIIDVNEFNIGEINKAKNEKILSGGKGINVSIVLSNLGIPNVALGFIAGFTGKEIKRKVEEAGVKTDFIELKQGMSRINIKIKSEYETAINSNGPEIRNEAFEKLFNKIEKLEQGDVLVLAGNIQNNIQKDIYEKICKIVENKSIKIIADATGKLLVNVLKHHPFLIKPNKYELEEIFGVKINSNEEIVEYASKLQQYGASNVMISMDANGAILLCENKEVFYIQAPKGKLVNSVGSGDSMVAGFLAEFLKSGNYEKSLKYAVASGSASAFSENLATKAEIEKLLEKM